MLLLLLSGCDREERRFREAPPSATPLPAVTLTELQAGPVHSASMAHTEYEENAWAIAEGKLLYSAFNCNGCHAMGGGGSGPPLMDDEWIYGSQPENVFATIVEGRPNGMPSFRGRMSNQQVWQLVSYVRSMSALTPKDARPGRDDHMQVTTPEVLREPRRPVQSTLPSPEDRD